jgi:ribosome-associated protein
MKIELTEDKDLTDELIVTASRSSGPGGQNVNKVSTRIELRFNIHESRVLNEEEKNILFDRLSSRITKDGYIIVVSQAGRSQYENRQKAVERFQGIIKKALAPVKKRIRTKPTKSSKLKRLDVKKIKSRKKEFRKPVDED